MQRVHTPEIMDRPDVDEDQLRLALGYIRGVNRRLGGVSALLTHLESWSAGWESGSRITLLDIATGSADIPVRASRWARSRGFDLAITAVDVHEKTLAEARRHSADDPGIIIERADAFELPDRFGDSSFDYVHAGLFLHHLEDEARVTEMLGIMDRIARRGVIWNDLMRTRVGYAAIHLLTLGQPEMIRHDARVSVRAGFTRREALRLADLAGLGYTSYASNYFTHRFTVAGEKR